MRKPHTLVHTTSEEPFLTQSDPNIQHRHRGNVPLRNFLFNWWLWELIGIATSLLCIFGIVVALRVFENKPVPALPSGITFNALISVLATLSKASMLVAVAACISQLKWHWFGQTRKMRDFEIFDQASRGPWGALQLIARTRSPWLVGLGAIITVVAIGVDPFMQQIIQFALHPQWSPGSAGVRRAQTYDAGASLSDCKKEMFLMRFGQNLR
jgi:hypothetical protein